MCESVGKANLLSDHFESKLPRESVDLLFTWHPSPSFITIAFRSNEVRHLLFNLDPYSGSDPLGMFLCSFSERTADVLVAYLVISWCFGGLFVSSFRLVWLICCQIILRANCLGSL